MSSAASLAFMRALSPSFFVKESSRKFIDKNLLAFSMSYEKFLRLEAVAEESFLTADAWQKIFKRI